MALNGYWVFVTPPLIYFFFRFFRKLLTTRVTLALCLAIISCMFAESVFSVYSYAVVNPRVRAAYRSNPEKLLSENGLSLEKDSRERLLFEKRLLESVEPTGTYGLTNTLGGTLAPVLVLMLTGFPWFRVFSQLSIERSIRRRFLITIRVAFVAIFFFVAVIALIMTKSRSAYIAFMFGASFWLFCRMNFKANPNRVAKKKSIKIVSAIAIISIALMTIAVASGAIDLKILSEAGKSFSYRLEYWIATSRMITDYPFWGIGAGEFQNLYPRYILPTASEFIADPHNFILEICALFGIPAAFAYVVFLLAVLISAISIIGAKARQNSISILNKSVENVGRDNDDFKSFKALFIGFSLGLATTCFCSLFTSAPIDLSFIVITSATFLLFFLIISPSPRVSGLFPKDFLASLCATVIALLTNLLTAGGIGYAPISTQLFFFAAIMVNYVANVQDSLKITDRSRERKRLEQRYINGKKLATFATVISLVILGVFYASSYLPRMKTFMFELKYDSNPESCSAELVNPDYVKKLDPYSSVIATQHYYAVGMAYFKNASSENQELWFDAKERLERVSPNSSSIRENCGVFDWRIFLENKNRKEFLESCVSFYKEAVLRSPFDVGKKEKLFLALRESGRNAEALTIAKQALEFDRETEHEDRKLKKESREEMQKFVHANN